MTTTVHADPSRTTAAAIPSLVVREAGSGPPLVMLHGLASSARYWEPHLRRLCRSWRVILPDLLGFGRSPRPRGGLYDVHEHLAALRAAIDVRIDGPFTLVGHSMGSILALHLAAAMPGRVHGMVLASLPVLGSCAWGHAPAGAPARWHHLTVHTALGRAVCGGGMLAVRPLWSRLPAPVLARLRPTVPPGAARDALACDWTAYWNSLEDLVYGSDVAALFGAAPSPIELIHGAVDRIVPVGPVRALAASRSDVGYTELADAAHNPCYTHPAALYGALGRVRPEGAARVGDDDDTGTAERTSNRAGERTYPYIR
jgi:pimeloyl-ACP methyl ester carboxylesterase